MRFRVSQPGTIRMRIGSNVVNAEVGFGAVQYIRDTSSIERYTGETEVTPKVDEEIVLETKEKIVPSDIMVLRLPIHRTSNTAGGTTVWIGGIIEDGKQ